jgi:SEC-C motif
MLQLTCVPKLTDQTRAFGRDVTRTEDVQLIPVRPARWGQYSDCYANVEEQVRRRGGSIIYGWIIWLIPNVMIEAEHHAVWCSPNGMLVCVSPHVRGERMVVFAPDPATPYPGNSIDNVRKPLSDDPVVAEFIAAGRARYDAMRDVLPGEFVTLKVNPKAQVDLNWRFARFTVSRRGKDDPCVCGSRRAFGKCCNLKPEDIQRGAFFHR